VLLVGFGQRIASSLLIVRKKVKGRLAYLACSISWRPQAGGFVTKPKWHGDFP